MHTPRTPAAKKIFDFYGEMEGHIYGTSHLFYFTLKMKNKISGNAQFCQKTCGLCATYITDADRFIIKYVSNKGKYLQ